MLDNQLTNEIKKIPGVKSAYASVEILKDEVSSGVNFLDMHITNNFRMVAKFGDYQILQKI